MITNKKVVIGIVVMLSFAVLVVFLYFYSRVPKQNGEELDIGSLTSYMGIRPGENLDSLIKTEGEPIAKVQEGSNEVYLYPSEFENYPDKVYKDKESEKIVFIKEAIKYDENRNVSEYERRLGKPDLTLYRNDLGPAYNVFVYLNDGVAVTSHVYEGSIFEIWYFEPADAETFSKSWGLELESQLKTEPDSFAVETPQP